jgi:hypothetical protein
VRLGSVRGTFVPCGRVVVPVTTQGAASTGKKAAAVHAQYDSNLSGPNSQSEVTRLVAEVHRAARQTGRVSHAVTRVAAEVQFLAGEVGALVAEFGRGLVPGIAPVARSVPGDQSSH